MFAPAYVKITNPTQPLNHGIRGFGDLQGGSKKVLGKVWLLNLGGKEDLKISHLTTQIAKSQFWGIAGPPLSHSIGFENPQYRGF